MPPFSPWVERRGTKRLIFDEKKKKQQQQQQKTEDQDGWFGVQQNTLTDRV